MTLLTPENIVALIMIFSLIVYVLTGGADFGGGVWDLLARGKRGQAQRDLIALRACAYLGSQSHLVDFFNCINVCLFSESL